MAEKPMSDEEAELEALLAKLSPADRATLERVRQQERERLRMLRAEAHSAREVGLELAPWWEFWRTWRPAR
jgi:hypothetical protein